MTPDEEVELFRTEYKAAVYGAERTEKQAENARRVLVEAAEAYGRALGARDGGNFT